MSDFNSMNAARGLMQGITRRETGKLDGRIDGDYVYGKVLHLLEHKDHVIADLKAWRPMDTAPSSCTGELPCSASDEYVSTDWQVIMASHGWPANTSALDDALTELAELRQDADDRKHTNYDGGHADVPQC